MILQFWRGFLALVFVAALAPAMLWAQEPASPDYKAWDKFATSAEATVAKGAASDADLTTLRGTLVDWRSQFTDAQTANQTRIETLRGQINALGPAPAEGAPAEDKAIADRRAELNAQLATLQAPGISAVEAFSRADGIVREIDRVVRDRQADALLQVSPLPINPANWPAGFSAITHGVSGLVSETLQQLEQPKRIEEAKAKAPVSLISLVLAVLILWLGRRVLDWLLGWLLKRLPKRSEGALRFLMTFAQVMLLNLGLVLLVAALLVTGLFGERVTAALTLIPPAGFKVLVGIWLAGQFFPRDPRVEPVLQLMADRKFEGRFYVAMLALLLALRTLVDQVFVPSSGSALALDLASGTKAVDATTYADAATGVVQLPMILLTALLLSRVGQLLRRHVANERIEGVEPDLRDRVIGMLGYAALAISAAAPLAAAVGYVNAANALIWPAVLTLGLLGLLVVVQRLFADIYIIVIRAGVEARDSLVPVLIGFALTLAAVPVLALIWGARLADLTEIWTSFRNGISIGGARLSPTVFLTLIVVFGLGYTVTRFVQSALKSTVLPKTQIDKGGQNAIVSGIGYIGIFIAALFAITAAGIDMSSLALIAGGLSLGVGFGMQNIVQNFVSGIILLIERPISEGDWIEVGGQQGIVKSISVRSTRIETFDRTDVIVPNADFVSGQVTNWTRGNLTGRVIVKVGVAYGTDTRKVEKILHEIAENHPMVSLAPAPRVFFIGFGADSLDFEIRAMLSDVNFRMVALSDMNHEIAARFSAEGIEIPFAQRDLWIRNPEALNPAPHGYVPAEAPKKVPAAARSEPREPEVAQARVNPLDQQGNIDNDGDDDDGGTAGESDGYGGGR
jgi:potassium-dependent mechanosensitive channel